MAAKEGLSARLESISLVAMDVDGVLTNGTITYLTTAPKVGEPHLSEAKSFSARDGLGITLARAAGLEIAWITGRVSPTVRKRAEELRVAHVCQWARNKELVLAELAQRLGLRREQVLYVGDDLNDLPAFRVASVKVAPADAVAEVRAAADWVTTAAGGAGAVREVIEGVLKAQGRWEAAVEGFLAELARQQDAPPPAQ